MHSVCMSMLCVCMSQDSRDDTASSHSFVESVLHSLRAVCDWPQPAMPVELQAAVDFSMLRKSQHRIAYLSTDHVKSQLTDSFQAALRASSRSQAHPSSCVRPAGTCPLCLFRTRPLAHWPTHQRVCCIVNEGQHRFRRPSVTLSVPRRAPAVPPCPSRTLRRPRVSRPASTDLVDIR